MPLYEFSVELNGRTYQCASEVTGLGPLRQTIHVVGVGLKHDMSRYGSATGQPSPAMLSMARTIAKQLIREGTPFNSTLDSTSLEGNDHLEVRHIDRWVPLPGQHVQDGVFDDFATATDEHDGVFIPRLTRLADDVLQFFGRPKSGYSAANTDDIHLPDESDLPMEGPDHPSEGNATA